MNLLRLHQVIKIIPVIFFAFYTSVFANGSFDIYEKPSDKPLAEILEDAAFAISEQNLRVVYRLHIGEAIRDRGKPEFPDFEVIMYCGIAFAEKMLMLEPEMINACPGRVTVRGKANQYIVAAPLWPENSGNIELDSLMHDMNILVRKIVDYAAQRQSGTPASASGKSAD